MEEKYYDALLNIKTVGIQKGFNDSFHYHRYEATPYHALELLFSKYEIKKSDRIVDFGCGKGRLVFYTHYLFNATVVGVEMNETFYYEAMENLKKYLKKQRITENIIHFYHCLAEDYEIHPLDNHFYFFNPFSIQIFRNIIKNILLSIERFPRIVEIVLYYPSDDYIYYLDNHTSFQLIEEIPLPGLYESNTNERFLIYQIENM